MICQVCLLERGMNRKLRSAAVVDRNFAIVCTWLHVCVLRGLPGHVTDLVATGVEICHSWARSRSLIYFLKFLLQELKAQHLFYVKQNKTHCFFLASQYWDAVPRSCQKTCDATEKPLYGLQLALIAVRFHVYTHRVYTSMCTHAFKCACFHNHFKVAVGLVAAILSVSLA